MAVGPIPEGRNVCHHCDRPLCVRPDHLFVGTQADNMADMAAKGRRRHFTGRPQKGETNYYAKLTEDDVRTIRKLEADGISRKVIAERFGIHPSNIYYIVSRKTWTHVL